jgi:hypothetical protein
MLAALIIVLCAGLNRARGDDTWMFTWGDPCRKWLPGRPLYYIALLFALADWRLGLAYFVWGVFGWGHLFGLGRFAPKDRGPSPLEAALLWVGRGNVHIAFCLRHALALPLLWWVVGPWALVFPLAVVAAYEAAWRAVPRNPILVAELLTGAIWGCLIIL